ncbi:hypothetical protein LI036_02110 [bacterium 210917-DFI.7.65]|nr:hypothetical protein [bacterium 210917-DFI.7.65]
MMRGLTPAEQSIITQIYVLGKTEQQASAALGWARSTFHRRKLALLKKLRTLLQKNF